MECNATITIINGFYEVKTWECFIDIFTRYNICDETIQELMKRINNEDQFGWECELYEVPSYEPEFKRTRILCIYSKISSRKGENMGFEKLDYLKLLRSRKDGYPVYSTISIRLQGTGTEEDFNSVSIKLSSVKKTKTIADDIEQVKEIEVGYDLELEVLNVKASALKKDAFGFKKDADGNIKGSMRQRRSLDYSLRVQTASGNIFQKYLYKIQFVRLILNNKQETGEKCRNFKDNWKR